VWKAELAAKVTEPGRKATIKAFVADLQAAAPE
jgi:hypothetical protein